MSVKNKLAQLAKAERNIAAFQKLSNIHVRTLNEHNDQLEFTWKNGYETGARDVRNIMKSTHQEAENALNQDVQFKPKLVLNLSPEQAEKYKQKLDSTPRHTASRIEPTESQFVLGTLQSQNKWVVQNWRKSWLWFSNITFALIVAVQAFFDTLPPELIATLPHDAQSKITMALAALGVIGRLINQSRLPKTPILREENNV
ncbi:DUF7940 domain-containing protein [Acinetobacter wuhouensis]|uniref:DUF7940 domain-containing protein n=1 Tax=Acinetobacter wuhouensis TaxID=1879050 RepID=UPI001BC870E6|nr:hypothetical protein [Acinetobacter wuhouensis]